VVRASPGAFGGVLARLSISARAHSARVMLQLLL